MQYLIVGLIVCWAVFFCVRGLLRPAGRDKAAACGDCASCGRCPQPTRPPQSR